MTFLFLSYGISSYKQFSLHLLSFGMLFCHFLFVCSKINTYFWLQSVTCGILGPELGIKPCSLLSKCRVLSTRLPRSSLKIFFDFPFDFFKTHYCLVYVVQFPDICEFSSFIPLISDFIEYENIRKGILYDFSLLNTCKGLFCDLT